MAYEKTEWLKRIIEHPDRYEIEDLGGGLFTITPSPGDVVQAGTPLTEDALNNLETQYDEAIEDVFDGEGVGRLPLTRMPAGVSGHFLKATGAGDNPNFAVLPLVVTASENISNANDTERTTGQFSYTKVKEIRVDTFFSGTIRIKFDAKDTSEGGKAKIYMNGAALGTERSTIAEYQTFSEDFNVTWSPGDLIQIYAHSQPPAFIAYVKDFRLCYNLALASTNQDP